MEKLITIIQLLSRVTKLLRGRFVMLWFCYNSHIVKFCIFYFYFFLFVFHYICRMTKNSSEEGKTIMKIDIDPHVVGGVEKIEKAKVCDNHCFD